MKTKAMLAMLVAAGALGLASHPALAVDYSASVAIRSEADFAAPLAEQGSWMDVPGYGRAWRPGKVDASWQPYSIGSWVWTENGWYWVSDEPWAWATYHYGRWVYDPRHHWVWVAGTEWAPSWVTWRVGGGYVGWAPLPPRVGFGRDRTIAAASVNVAPEQYVYVRENRFSERFDRQTLLVNDRVAIKSTAVVTNIRQENRSAPGTTSQTVVVNEGPGLVVMQKATNQKIRTLPTAEVLKRTPAPASVPRVVRLNPPPNPDVPDPVPPDTKPLGPVTRVPPVGTPTSPGRVENIKPAPPPGHIPRVQEIPAPDAVRPVQPVPPISPVPAVGSRPAQVAPGAQPPRELVPATLPAPAPTRPVPPSSEQQISPGNQGVPPATRPVPPMTRGVPPITRGVPPATKGAPPGTRPIPPATQPIPPATQGVRPPTQVVPPGQPLPDERKRREEERPK